MSHSTTNTSGVSNNRAGYSQVGDEVLPVYLSCGSDIVALTELLIADVSLDADLCLLIDQCLATDILVIAGIKCLVLLAPVGLSDLIAERRSLARIRNSGTAQ